MDQNVLVSSGQSLVKAMDETGLAPRIAMWVHNSDTDTWKLWIVPPRGLHDKREFYRSVAAIIARNRDTLQSIDASDTEMVPESHPAMKGLGRVIRMPGLGVAHFAGNRFNGFYLPDGIVLRSAL
ncbi:hypothetical protein [Rhodoplanes sp. SY1]|uniref:hypothetical protein n=1 Tax=Rhodoplanes sp. SY1 TaxID=3166646 RepID=UPI0038B66C62